MGNKTTEMSLDAEGFRVQEMTHVPGQIYGLIGKAMAEIGAIGKDSVNQQQGFKYRGIDAVYNTLYPVMAKYGLFITPEIICLRRFSNPC